MAPTMLCGKLPALSRAARSILAGVLCVLIVPLSDPEMLAQDTSNSQPPVTAPAAQPLTPDQLDQLVAPIALYPDALIAQILAASTYPTQIVDADRWFQGQTGKASQDIAAAANNQTWDPSVKALIAFPTVLAQMDKNLDWTTNLGNAYYNQPHDVMDAVQTMRQRAGSAGNLKSTSQQTVSTLNGNVVIAPANPSVVYVPAYDPWIVYGSPIAIYPGFYYAPPPGIVFGAGIAIGFGVGIAIGAFGGWGWGWNNWRLGWHSRIVVFNHATYVTRSGTVINRGYARPGGPLRGAGPRGAYARASHPNSGDGHTSGRTQTQRNYGGARRGGFGSRTFAGGHGGGGQHGGRR
jgi:hypothetical protein